MAQLVQQAFHFMRQACNILVSHGAGHALQAVRGAEHLRKLVVAGIFLHLQQAARHILKIFMGFSKKKVPVLFHYFSPSLQYGHPAV